MNVEHPQQRIDGVRGEFDFHVAGAEDALLAAAGETIKGVAEVEAHDRGELDDALGPEGVGQDGGASVEEIALWAMAVAAFCPGEDGACLGLRLRLRLRLSL